jgi:hypothetical protein
LPVGECHRNLTEHAERVVGEVVALFPVELQFARCVTALSSHRNKNKKKNNNSNSKSNSVSNTTTQQQQDKNRRTQGADADTTASSLIGANRSHLTM